MAENKQAVDKIQLVVGFGYDNAQLAELRHPVREDLDAVSTELPICLVHQSGHIISVNSKALEVGGISAATPNPTGGVIQRGKDGKEPNGVLEETAAFPLLIKLLVQRLRTFCKVSAGRIRNLLATASPPLKTVDRSPTHHARPVCAVL